MQIYELIPFQKQYQYLFKRFYETLIVTNNDAALRADTKTPRH